MLGAGESNDRPAEIDPSTWERLLAVYGNPDDIDAFTGGLAERSQDGGMVGPLFAEIIRQQFELLRDGDRFFFTHKEDASTKARGLGPVAKSAILKRTLGAVLCDVIPTDIITSKSLGKSVFKTVSDENPDLDCSSVEEMDFGSIFEESMGMKRRAGRYGFSFLIWSKEVHVRQLKGVILGLQFFPRYSQLSIKTTHNLVGIYSTSRTF